MVNARRGVLWVVGAFVGLPALLSAQNQLGPPPAPILKDPSDLVNIYQGLVGHWFSVIGPYAYDLFSVLAGLEIAVFGWDLWRNYSGDIKSAILATANKVLIIGFFLSLLMNAGPWMATVINMFETLGKLGSGVQGLGPSAVLLQGFQIFGPMLWQATKSGLFLDLPTAIALLFAGIIIFLSFLGITVQFVITKINTFVALGMGVIFLGFGGSRWTVSYVERYFALCVTCGVKLMVLYLLVGAGGTLAQGWVKSANAVTLSTASVEVAFSIAAGALLYGSICWFSSSIVSAILGGSPNLTHSDVMSFMAPAVSAGVTTGLIAAGIASGGAGAAAGAAVAGASTSGGLGGSNPTGASPASGAGSSSSGGGAGAAVAAVGSVAQAGASAIRQMPHAGHSSPPPSFNGFHH